MSDANAIAPGQEVTFTVTKAPRREAQRKTIQRLMQMQPDVRNGLKRLARRRRQHDNRAYTRAGVEWVARVKATRLTRVEPGATFSLTVTPQIVRDIESVKDLLQTKAS